MKSLDIGIEWLDPGEMRGSELRATWGRLEIRVGNEPVTRVYDAASRSVREGIHVSLYPLAEWLATHLWPLLNEPFSRARPQAESYSQRHSLRHAGDGYLYPDLMIIPLGDKVLLSWQGYKAATADIEYLGEGECLVERASLKRDIEKFLFDVCGRLTSLGIEETLLQEEWAEIQRIANSSEEDAYCTALGTLGLDPFDVDEKVGDAVIQLNKNLPSEVFRVAMESLGPESTLDAVHTLEGLVDSARKATISLDWLPSSSELGRLKKHRGEPPWWRGYELAHRVRDFIGNPDEPIQDEWLSYPPASTALPSLESLEGIAAAGGKRKHVGFVLKEGRPESQRFRLCRLIYHYMTTGSANAWAISNAATQQQRSGRAFAAEFLAPHEVLAAHAADKTPDDDLIDSLAARFRVSPMVIHHQLENHGIIPGSHRSSMLSSMIAVR